MPCVPALVRWMIVLPRKSVVEISKGELPKSKPPGARPRTSPMQTPPIPVSRSAKASLTVRTITILDGPVRQGYGSGCEGAENVNYRDRAGCPRCAFEQAVDRDIHFGAAPKLDRPLSNDANTSRAGPPVGANRQSGLEVHQKSTRFGIASPRLSRLPRLGGNRVGPGSGGAGSPFFPKET